MGAVHAAYDRVAGRMVALKTLHPSAEGATAVGAEDLRRFVREIEALALLHHPGIVRLHDVGRWEG